jgi:hypothetical protein
MITKCSKSWNRSIVECHILWFEQMWKTLFSNKKKKKWKILEVVVKLDNGELSNNGQVQRKI